MGQGGWGQVGDVGGVEVLQSFEAGKPGFLDPADAAAGLAVVALGGEHLGQVGAVGESFARSCLGDRCGLRADGGQPEGSAGRGDGGLGGGLGQRGEGWPGRGGGHAPTPISAS